MDFFKDAIAWIGRFFGLPDINDSAAVRRMVQRILGHAADAVKKTDTLIDDAFVAGLQAFVDDDVSWDTIYSFVFDRLAGESVEPPPDNAGILAAAILGAYGEETDD